MDSFRYRCKQKKLDRQRKQRLLQKAQKARAIDALPEVYELHSWNSRFGYIQKLRATNAKKS